MPPSSVTKYLGRGHIGEVQLFTSQFDIPSGSQSYLVFESNFLRSNPRALLQDAKTAYRISIRRDRVKELFPSLKSDRLDVVELPAEVEDDITNEAIAACAGLDVEKFGDKSEKLPGNITSGQVISELPLRQKTTKTSAADFPLPIRDKALSAMSALSHETSQSGKLLPIRGKASSDLSHETDQSEEVLPEVPVLGVSTIENEECSYVNCDSWICEVLGRHSWIQY